MAEVWGRLEAFYDEKWCLFDNCEGLLVGIELAPFRLSLQPSQALLTASAATTMDGREFFRQCKGKWETVPL